MAGHKVVVKKSAAKEIERIDQKIALRQVINRSRALASARSSLLATSLLQAGQERNRLPDDL